MKVGNIKEDDFEELWTHNKVLNDLRDKDLLEGNCGTCQYRYYCGGCRARAYGYTGNCFSPDPGCLNNLSCYNTLVMNTTTPRTSSPLDSIGELKEETISVMTV